MKLQMNKSKKNLTYSNKELRDMLKGAVESKVVMEIMEGLMNDDDVYERAINILMDLDYDFLAGPTDQEIEAGEKQMLLGARMYKYGKSEGARRYGKTILRHQGIEGDNDAYFDGD